MKKLILFGFFLLVGIQAQAKTLVISDIDDTIKISHILSLEKIVSAADPLKEFSGMSELYEAVKKANSEKNEPIKFAYVSNAPVAVMYVSHSSFLYLNNFPSGELLLRESLFVDNHKVETIKQFIAVENPDTVIMIGDNGEIDGQVYDTIEKYFANSRISFHTFIHQVYSTNSMEERGHPLLVNQNGFVTALDLGVSLHHAGLLDYANFESFWKRSSSNIIYSKISFFDSDVFPDWMNCADYHHEKSISARFLGSQLTQLLMQKCK